jgi:hypothetical protein
MHVADTFNYINVIRLSINSSIYFIIIRREPSSCTDSHLINHYFRLSQNHFGYDESFSDSAKCREKSSQALLWWDYSMIGWEEESWFTVW